MAPAVAREHLGHGGHGADAHVVGVHRPRPRRRTGQRRWPAAGRGRLLGHQQQAGRRRRSAARSCRRSRCRSRGRRARLRASSLHGQGAVDALVGGDLARRRRWTGTISSATRPAACAAPPALVVAGQRELVLARARSTPYRSATFSAVSPRLIGRVHLLPSSGLTRRQPSRVWAAPGLPRPRARPPGAGRTAPGSWTRSRPPRRCPGHRRRWRGRPDEMASMPEPHSRFTVAPGTSTPRPGQQHAHPGHVAVVLAGLVGGAPVHVVDAGRVQPAAAGQQRLQHAWRSGVGPDAGQRAPDLPDRGPAGVDGEDCGHGGITSFDLRPLGVASPQGARPGCRAPTAAVSRCVSRCVAARTDNWRAWPLLAVITGNMEVA